MLASEAGVAILPGNEESGEEEDPTAGYSAEPPNIFGTIGALRMYYTYWVCILKTITSYIIKFPSVEMSANDQWGEEEDVG